MKREKVTLPFTWFFLKIRPVLRWLIKLRSSPKAIAGGFALGLFIAFTPTIGAQIIISVILATSLNVNRTASVLAVWLTNPATIPAIFTFNYWVGSHIFPGPSVSEVSRTILNLASRVTKLDVWEIKGQLLAVSELGFDIIIPLFIGSILNGIVCAGLSYIVLLRLLEGFFERRERKRKSKTKMNT